MILDSLLIRHERKVDVNRSVSVGNSLRIFYIDKQWNCLKLFRKASGWIDIVNRFCSLKNEIQSGAAICLNTNVIFYWHDGSECDQMRCNLSWNQMQWSNHNAELSYVILADFKTNIHSVNANLLPQILANFFRVVLLSVINHRNTKQESATTLALEWWLKSFN
jgi:hypothetical protein